MDINILFLALIAVKILKVKKSNFLAIFERPKEAPKIV